MSIHDRVARYAAVIRGDLSADEIDALYEQLHRKGQHSIYISCNRAECSALANSFDQLFKRLGWPSTIGEIQILVGLLSNRMPRLYQEVGRVGGLAVKRLLLSVCLVGAAVYILMPPREVPEGEAEDTPAARTQVHHPMS